MIEEMEADELDISMPEVPTKAISVDPTDVTVAPKGSPSLIIGKLSVVVRPTANVNSQLASLNLITTNRRHIRDLRLRAISITTLSSSHYLTLHVHQ